MFLSINFIEFYHQKYILFIYINRITVKKNELKQNQKVQRYVIYTNRITDGVNTISKIHL